MDGCSSPTLDVRLRFAYSFAVACVCILSGCVLSGCGKSNNANVTSPPASASNDLRTDEEADANEVTAPDSSAVESQETEADSRLAKESGRSEVAHERMTVEHDAQDQPTSNEGNAATYGDVSGKASEENAEHDAATPESDAPSEQASASHSTEPEPAVDLSNAVRLLLPTTVGPLVVAVDLRIGDQSLQLAYETRVLQVMEQASEGDELTWPMLFQHIASDAQQFGRMPVNSNQYQNMIRVYDKNRNKRPDADEVAKFLFRNSGFTVPFRLVGSNHFRDVNRSQSALFKTLDTNENRQLEPSEMDAAADSLFLLDVDGDRRIVASEVVDNQQTDDAWKSRRSSRWGEVAMDVSGYIDWTMLAYTLDETPKCGVFGGNANAVAKLDQNEDGAIGSEEARALASVDPDLAIQVSYATKTNGAPEVKILSCSSAIRDLANLEVHGSSIAVIGEQLQLIFHATDVAASPNRIPPEAFAALDANKDGGLDESEIPAGAFAEYSFEDLDADGDKKLTLKEIREGMIPDAPIWGVQIRGRGAEAPDGVFAWLDQDRDRVLSEREITQVVERLRAIAAVSDSRSDQILKPGLPGALRASSIPDTFELHLTRGDPAQADQLFQFNNFSQAKRPAMWPRWAEAMDINRDGDISRTEFLGSDVQFRTLDANRDGFIHGDELE